MELGKIPPQAIEIEEKVIGTMLLYDSSIHIVSNILNYRVFYKNEHIIIYKTIMELYDKGKPIDLAIITNELNNKGLIDEIGGSYYLVQLTANVVSSANIEYYSRILLQKYIQRELITYSDKIMNMAYDNELDIDDMLSDANYSLQKVNESLIVNNGFKNISDIGDIALKEFEERIILAKENKVVGITSGIRGLDKLTLGWRNSWLIVLAARTGIGKTAMMLTFSKASAITGKKVCIYSLEMSNMSLYDRIIIAESGVNSYEYNSGNIYSNDTIHKVKQAKNRLSQLPIYIDDKPKASIRYMRGHLRLMKDKGLCDIVFIDFLQLADYTGNKKGQEAETSEMAKDIQQLAKEFNIPIILLSQLNRICETRKDKKPELHDLRYSGAIEEAADIVLLGHRPNKYGIETMEEGGNEISSANRLHIILAKNRHGAIGTIPCYHSDDLTIIKDWKDYENDVYVKKGKPLPF